MHQGAMESLKAARQEAMRLLAVSPAADVKRLYAGAGLEVDAETLRGPETGLVTVRGRIGGGGAPFNVGEATVTRATVKLSTGEIGHAYALGRDGEKVRLAATVDALLQRDGEFVEARIIAPLREAHAEAIRRKQAETAATKVDFFTMVRGED